MRISRIALGLALSTLTACQSPSLMSLPEAPVWIAHRGNSVEAPENTLSSVGLALRLDPQPQFVEIDVQLSADGELVVIHDDDLQRTTGVAGKVSEKSWAELAGLRAGFAERFQDQFADEQLPRLAQVLDLAAEYDGRIMIEVKARGAGEGVGRLLFERGEIEQHIVASFKPAVLAAAKRMAPGVRVLYLASEPNLGDIALAQELEASILGCHHESASRSLAESVHRAGMQLWCYTVNDAARARELRKLGVDGVISDQVSVVRER